MKKIEVNDIGEKGKASIKTRVITAVILAAIVAPSIFLGGWFFFIISLVVGAMASYELVHVTNITTKFKYLVYIATVLLFICFTYWILVRNNITL